MVKWIMKYVKPTETIEILALELEPAPRKPAEWYTGGYPAPTHRNLSVEAFLGEAA